MKDVQLLMQYVKTQRPLGAAWENPLWEDFPDMDLEENEPPLDPEYDDLANGAK